VESLGPGTSLWKIGEPVMGVVGGGAHAEFVCVHEREAMPAPTVMPLEECAAIPEAFLTAYDALFDKLHLHAGESLLIHAAGSGVGTAAIQLARLAGVTTVGTSRSQVKLDRCLALGLSAAFHVTDDDWSTKLLADIRLPSVHAVLDLVGAAYLQGNLEILGAQGRMVSVGLTAGSKGELDMRLLMRKRITIVGTVLRARPIEEKITLARDFAERMVPRFADHTLRPVIDSTLPFSEIRAAHEAMEANRTFGKIVLAWS
jgi:NADPH:quinone reductase-like Zn-dependent oxidoreductase